MADSDSKSQKIIPAQFENLRSTDSKALKQAMESDDVTRAGSDTEDTAVGTSEVSRKGNGRKKLTGNEVTLGETTLDLKTRTDQEPSTTQLSARKAHNSSAANLFQLTASQSVDLIKPCE